MKKMNFNNKHLLILSALFVGTLVSCASAKVYVTDLQDFNSTGITQEIDWGMNNLSWNGFKLKNNDQTKEKVIDYKKFGLDSYDNKKGLVSSFYKNGNFLYDTYFITVSNNVAIKEVLNNKTLSYLIVGPKSTKLEILGTPQDTVMIEDNSVLPLKVTRIGKLEREGKIYSMPANNISGVRIKLYGQNYAIIDFVSDEPRILMCQTFEHDLTEDEKTFVSSLMLLLYLSNSSYSSFVK